ncbi:pyridoxal-dependent decarboxylase [Magnetococcales bacterium HHB-1]
MGSKKRKSKKKNIKDSSQEIAHPQPSIPYGPTGIPWSSQLPVGAASRAPQESPLDAYPALPPKGVDPSLPGIDYRKLEVPPTGLTKTQWNEAMTEVKNYLLAQVSHFTGFQTNMDESYAKRFDWLLDTHTNNVGDPFSAGLFTPNTKFLERAVLDWFAALWNAPWPHRQGKAGEVTTASDRYWGYVLNMGSTEGNMYGLYNARDYLKGRLLIEDPNSSDEEEVAKAIFYADPCMKNCHENAYRPIAFYSEDTHYSVVKSVRLLEIPTFAEEGRRLGEPCPLPGSDGIWPEEVPSHNDDNDSERSGTINLESLEILLRFFLERGYPVLMVLNEGSTWKGAYDDADGALEMLQRLGEDYPDLWEREIANDHGPGHLRRRFWVHIDGALGASYLPFIEMAYNQGKLKEKGPMFDFRNDAVMSIVSSLHKWIGAPWPSGVYMTKVAYQLQPPSTAGYIGSPDTTFGGSRTAFSPLIYWDYIARHSYEDNMNKVISGLDCTDHCERELRLLEKELKERFGPEVDLWIARSKLSLAMRFRAPNPDLVYKWTIDTERLKVPLSDNQNQERTYAHIYMMQSLDRNRINLMIQEIREACKEDWHHAFPIVDGDGKPNPGPAVDKAKIEKQIAGICLGIPGSGRGFRG